MDPDLFAAFVEAFTEEWNRLAAEAGAGRAQQGAELETVQRQLDRLVDALANGAPVGSVRDRMVTLKARRDTLRSSLAQAEPPAPRLHPVLAQVYRRKVAELCQALERESGREAWEIVRGLVEEVRLVQEEGMLRIEVRGALAAILALVSADRTQKRPDGGSIGALAAALCEQI